MDSVQLLAAFDFALRELALFAGTGFLLLGLSDLAVDLIWLFRRRPSPAVLADLPASARPGTFAVFVPAWDEAGVIAHMLGHALRSWAGRDFIIYVGCYPNDPDTIAAVRQVGAARVRLVIGPAPGPTTKADCLNRLWDAMRADESASRVRYKAVLLHDAEDIVHSAEIDLFDRLIDRFDLVQIPVLPLIHGKSRWISPHYADEFGEAHGKGLVVRQAIGAAIPSAGVGCAISREALDRLAEGGAPFHTDSLVEDYELGLRLSGRSAFVRIAAAPGKGPIATRAYFPDTLRAAVAQKTRWVQGIALRGWDRLGWSGGIAERWMRMRDRESLLAALLLAAGYAAFFLYLLRGAAAGPAPIDRALALLLLANGFLLVWRLGFRIVLTAGAHGWRQGLWSVPRAFVANWIAILSAARAVTRYLAGRNTRWDKTDHSFPAEIPAE